MNPESLIGQIGCLLVEDLLKETRKTSNYPLHLNGIESNGALKHFNLIPELLGTTNCLLTKDTNNDEGNDDEDIRFFLQQMNNAQRGHQQRNPTKPEDPSMSRNNSTPIADKRAGHRLKRKLEACRTNDESVLVALKSGSPSTFIGDVDLLNVFDHLQFENHLHMNKLSFLKIFQFIRNIVSKHTFFAGNSAQVAFSLAVWKLTTGDTFEAIAQRFQRTRRNTRKLIQQFWQILGQNYHCYIKWPNSLLSKRLQLQGFQQHPRLQKIFQELFAIILLKRFKVHGYATSGNDEGRDFEVIIQIICNADQKVINCHLELADGYHFDSTPIAKKLNENYEQILPKQCYLIGSNCFPLRTYLLTPFPKPQTQNELIFNRCMSKILHFGAETLNTIIKRFSIFKDNQLREVVDLNEARQIMQTVCVLHNLSIAIEDDYVERTTTATGTASATKRSRETSYCDVQEYTDAEYYAKDEPNEAALERRQHLMINISRNCSSI